MSSVPDGSECTDAGGCAGTCLSGSCDASCPAAPHDSVLLPPKPLSVSIGAGITEVTKEVAITVRNADPGSATEGSGHIIELLADSTNCPLGTIGTPYFGPPGGQASILVGPGTTKTAKVPITINSDAFQTFNKKVPTRCTVTFVARAVVPGGNSDPTPSNDRATLEINVLDHNDVEQTATHEAYVRSASPVSITISGGRSEAAKRISVAVGNGDYGPPADLDPIMLVASDDPRCPGVTVTDIQCRRGSDTPVVRGGGMAPCRVTVVASADQVSTPNLKAPQRCVVLLRALGLSEPESPPLDPTNNATALVVDVINRNQ